MKFVIVMIAVCILIASSFIGIKIWENRIEAARAAEVRAQVEKMIKFTGGDVSKIPPVLTPVEVEVPEAEVVKRYYKHKLDGTLEEVTPPTTADTTKVEKEEEGKGKPPELKPGDTLPDKPSPLLSDETPTPTPTSTYPTLAGLKFSHKGKVGPYNLHTATEDKYWYTIADEKVDMGMMGVDGVKGLIVRTEGPVIYHYITTEFGQIGIGHRVKVVSNSATRMGRTWDYSKKEWGPPHDFDMSKIPNITGIRVLKDPDDPNSIQVEIGLPKKE